MISWSGEIQSHINAYGRRAGRFSFLKKQFDLNHWQTPAVLDTEPFQLDSLSKTHARLSKIMNLVNYSGYNFRAKVDRKVSIFNSSDIEKNLDISIGDQLYVGYQSENILTNLGQTSWKKNNGLLSILNVQTLDTWVIIF